MVTIRDVAKKAGCAISTVSYAFNGDTRIRPETRERIMAIASEMGYYPMNAARALKSKKNFTVGIFAISYLSPVFNELLDSISVELAKGGYNTFTTTSRKTVSQMITELSDDGFIVMDAILGDELIEHTGKIKLPLCFLNQTMSGDNIITSVQDNMFSLYSMVKMIVAKGCRSVAFLNGHPDSFDSRQRYLGYIKACEEFDITQTVFDGDFTIKSGYMAVKKIIGAGLKLDALVCANDEMCVGALEAFREHGIAAPRDILVSGYDDIELSRYYSPHITTVSIDRYEWGRISASRILSMLNGLNVEKSVIIRGEIVERESTRA